MSYPTCSHILTKGTLCQSPALTDSDLCYYHSRDYQRKENLQQARELKCSDQFYKYPMQQELLNPEIIESLDIPSLDDGPSIQVAVTNIVRLVLSGHITEKRAGLALFGCQIAAGNLGRVHLDIYKGDSFSKTYPHPIQPYLETNPHPAGYLDDLKAARKLIDAAQKLGAQERTAPPPADLLETGNQQCKTDNPHEGEAASRQNPGMYLRQNGELSSKGEGGTSNAQPPSRETGNGRPETVLRSKPTPKTFAQHIRLAAALHQGHLDAAEFAKEQKLSRNDSVSEAGAVRRNPERSEGPSWKDQPKPASG